MIRESDPHWRPRDLWLPARSKCESDRIRHLIVSDLTVRVDHQFGTRTAGVLHRYNATTVIASRAFDPVVVVTIDVGVAAISFWKRHRIAHGNRENAC